MNDKKSQTQIIPPARESQRRKKLKIDASFEEALKSILKAKPEKKAKSVRRKDEK